MFPISSKDKLHNIALIPGEIFFVSVLSVEEGSSAENIRNLAEMTLENSAPFPLDQLAWGFYRISPTQVSLFACSLKSAHKANAKISDEAEQVFPAFLPLLMIHAGSEKRKMQRASVLAIAYEDSLSLLHANDDGSIRVESAKRELPSTLEEEAKPALSDTEFFAQHFPKTDLGKVTFWELESITKKNNHLFFSLKNAEHKQQVVFILNRAEKWNADLRSRDFIVQEQKRRRNAVLAVRFMQAAVATIILGIGIFAWNAFAQWQLGKLRNTITEKTAPLNYLTARMNIANQVEAATEVTLQPFRVLEEINKVRPNELYFQIVRAKGKNEISIEGIGTNLDKAIQTVNNYVEEIRKLPSIEDIKSDPRITGKEVRFKFDIVASFPQQ